MILVGNRKRKDAKKTERADIPPPRTFPRKSTTLIGNGYAVITFMNPTSV